MIIKTIKVLTLVALLPLIAVMNSATAGKSPAAKAAGVVQFQSGSVKQMQLARGQNNLPAQRGQKSSC